MAEVTVKIYGRDYPLYCEDGQERQLMALAKRIDEQVTKLAQSLGPNAQNISQSHLLVMTCLLLGDKLSTLEQAQNQENRPHFREAEDTMARYINELAQNVEELAESLEAA